MSDEPRVWIGCLGCYNAGTLAGGWFDAADCPTEMAEFNDRLGFPPGAGSWELQTDAYRPLDPDPSAKGRFSAEHGDPVYGPHEELWVMDFENFHGFLDGECSPCTAKEIAEALEEVEDWGVLDAFMTFTGPREYDTVAETIAAAGEKFMAAAHPTEDNHWMVSEFDVAWDYLQEICYFEGLPEHLETHRGAIVRDWLDNYVHGGEIHVVHHGGAVYLFTQ